MGVVVEVVVAVINVGRQTYNLADVRFIRCHIQVTTSDHKTENGMRHVD